MNESQTRDVLLRLETALAELHVLLAADLPDWAPPWASFHEHCRAILAADALEQAPDLAQAIRGTLSAGMGALDDQVIVRDSQSEMIEINDRFERARHNVAHLARQLAT